MSEVKNNGLDISIDIMSCRYKVVGEIYSQVNMYEMVIVPPVQPYI